MPLISIIVPVYNVEPYLAHCLDSILAQTFSDFEAVLVDDGSIDQSGTICEDYASRDNRLIVIHKNNEGVAKARITALEHCTGELITFIDADDYVSPEYLGRLSKPILEEGADMVSCNYYDVEANSQIESADKKTLQGSFTGKSLKEFISNHYFYDKSCKGFGMTNFLCTKMIKKSYCKNGLYEGVGMWFGEDQIAMFSMLYRINHLCVIPDRLYYYVHYQGQATRRYDYSLWESLVRMFESYRRLDVYNMAHSGLRIRTWLYIKRTILKMIASKVSLSVFVDHFAKIRKHKYLKDFFKSTNTGLGGKDDVLYWILKLGWTRVYYSLFKLKQNF